MSVTRRAVLAAPFASAFAADAADAIHNEVWRRFIDRRWSTMYDYAGLQGEVILPSREDCALQRPNALAWWTPIENGAFFGGLYLEALVRRAQRTQTPQSREDARKIAHGLVRLASVGATPGFVARGVIADGKSHYAAGSDDQTFPWFYGLWHYARSPLPDRREKQKLVELLVRTARAIQSLNWRMPCDRGFGTRGEWTGENFIHASRLLFVLRAMYDLTRDSSWLGLYRTLGEKRLEFCARGASYEPPGSKDRYPDNPPFWTSASSQAAMRALLDLEDSDEFRSAFRRGLNANAAGAAQHIELYRSFDNNESSKFEVDWRFLNEFWKKQRGVDDAVQLGSAQVREWHRRSPRRVYEARFMREPLFAAWVVSLAESSDIQNQYRDQIRAAVSHYDPTRLYTSLIFIGQNIHENLLAR